MEIELLKEVECPQWVIGHSKLVSEIALNIAEYYPEADKNLVKTGALLHDIGRSKSNNIDHAHIGALILKERMFPEEVVNIVEKHIGTGLSSDDAKLIGIPVKDYTPLTLEEKIVSHADNLTNGDKQVSVDFTAEKWGIKLGENHPSITKLYENHEKLILSKGVKL